MRNQVEALPARNAGQAEAEMEGDEMRPQFARWARHAGVMLATCLVSLTAAAAGRSGDPPRQVGAAPPDGAQIYRTYCAACHGVSARGDGPVAMEMRVPPPDLTVIAKGNHGMFPSERVRQIIEGKGVAAHGDRLMPVWGDVFMRKIGGRDPHVLIGSLVHYLDTIQERPGE